MIKNIKKQLRLLLIAVLVGSSAFAQPTEKSLLWKISGKGIEQPSYLFGTNHLVCDKDYFWTEAMDKALKDCKEMCMEMDVNDMQKMQEVTMGMMDGSGKTLKDYFSPDEYVKLETFFRDSAKVNLAIFAPMKPIAVLGVLEKVMVRCEGKQLSYEMEILKMAKAGKRNICGLETPEETLEILNSMPVDTAVASINEFMNNRGRAQWYHDEMLRLYKEQDIEGIYNLVHTAGSMGSSEERFIDNRNRKWVSTIDSKVKGITTFYAVGAGHLGGENGLLNLLRKEGYKVTAVK